MTKSKHLDSKEGKLKKQKLDFFLYKYFICNDCTKERVHRVIFFNDDDNVCKYCGSKDTDLLLQARLKAEIIIY